METTISLFQSQQMEMCCKNQNYVNNNVKHVKILQKIVLNANQGKTDLQKYRSVVANKDSILLNTVLIVNLVQQIVYNVMIKEFVLNVEMMLINN